MSSPLKQLMEEVHLSAQLRFIRHDVFKGLFSLFTCI